MCLRIAEVIEERPMFEIDVVVVKRNALKPVISCHLLRELHQLAAKAGALRGRIDGEILDEQRVVALDQDDRAYDRIAAPRFRLPQSRRSRPEGAETVGTPSA